jgi:phosphoglycolate phosphatase
MQTMTQQPLTGVIFDLDGTLVDSVPDIRNALNRFLTSRGRRAVTKGEAEAAVGDGVFIMVERIMAVTGGVPPDVRQETAAFIEMYHENIADPAQIYPHVSTVLAHLQQNGIALGLCTNKPEAVTLKLLNELDLRRYFWAVAGGDTFPTHKPDPAHLRGVIEQLGLHPSGCVMVGDSKNDYLAAQGLGIPCIMVDYGYGADAALLGAAATISSMGDLPAALTRVRHFGT